MGVYVCVCVRMCVFVWVDGCVCVCVCVCVTLTPTQESSPSNRLSNKRHRVDSDGEKSDGELVVDEVRSM